MTEPKPLDRSSSIEMKALQKSPSLRLKHPPPFKQSYDENEFANRLNSKRSNSIRTSSYSLADLQLATGNFSAGRLLGEGSIGRVYRAKYADGKVLSAWLLHLLLFPVLFQARMLFLALTVREETH